MSSAAGISREVDHPAVTEVDAIVVVPQSRVTLMWSPLANVSNVREGTCR